MFKFYYFVSYFSILTWYILITFVCTVNLQKKVSSKIINVEGLGFKKSKFPRTRYQIWCTE